jgi:hypothetical protein
MKIFIELKSKFELYGNANWRLNKMKDFGSFTLKTFDITFSQIRRQICLLVKVQE